MLRHAQSTQNNKSTYLRNGWLYNVNDINNLIPKGTVGLCSIHIAQLITHAALYLIQPLTKQLCY